MDGLQSAGKNKECGVVIVGATNRVGQLPIIIFELTHLNGSTATWFGRRHSSEIGNSTDGGPS